MPAVKRPKPQKTVPSTPRKKLAPAQEVVSGQLQKKLDKTRAKPPKIAGGGKDRGVIVVKHLPHGFFEEQLKNYFKQFGRVTRVRLARSKRTGGSKGFAFVEFEYPEVAKVAAETMDNYLMFQKVVKAAYIPPSDQRFNYFKTSVEKVKNKVGEEIFVSGKIKAAQRKVKKQNNWNESACQKRTIGCLKKLKKLQYKYAHLGINLSDVIVQPTKIEKEAVKSTEKKIKKESQSKDLKLQDLLENTLNDEDSDDSDFEAGDSEDEASDHTYSSDEETDEDDSEESGRKNLQLKDLFDDTLNDEDSDDEEFEANSSDDDDSDISEEETEEDEDEEELSSPEPVQKKQKAIIDRETKLLKRKPGTGGVHKKKSVTAGTKPRKNFVNPMLEMTEVKKLAKPLKSLKSNKKHK